MVLLTTAAAFALLGIVVFTIGLVADRPELAMFGAVVMIGVGGTGVVQGYQVKNGTDVEVFDNRSRVALDSISQSNPVISKDIPQDNEVTGIDFSEDGNRMFVSGASTDTIYQFEGGRYDLSLATETENFSVAAQDTTPTGVEFDANGTRMYVTGDATNTVYQYDLGEPFNVSTASLNGSLTVGPHVTSPRATDFKPDGTRMYVAGNGDSTIHEYDLSVPYDVTTATHTQDFDTSAQESNPTGLDFSLDGSRALIVGSGSNNVYLYELSTPYDIDTASYAGDFLDVGTQVGTASGVAYEDDGRKLFVSDRQGDTAEQYNSSTYETIEVEETRDVYQDVEAISSFPLEIVVLLLGAVMLMTGAGEASEQGRDTPPWRRDN